MNTADHFYKQEKVAGQLLPGRGNYHLLAGPDTTALVQSYSDWLAESELP